MSHRVGEHVVRPKFRQQENEKHQHRKRKDVAFWPGLDCAPEVLYGDVPRGPRRRRRNGSDIYSYMGFAHLFGAGRDEVTCGRTGVGGQMQTSIHRLS